ncbi:FAD/NAD(P)-binding domain-containing protein [Lentzea roselyniae]|uniref:FAD/NAD(P)-binding domain-containing protein n=1 Tax=Lentzea roselyniae TaxID=531940 RepID=A0ABP7CF35_9PSEU
MLKLAVVGGGPSAVCVVDAVARHLTHDTPVEITVFEPGPNLWQGQAFQSDGDEVLANVPMVAMSARTWDRRDGVNWMLEQGLDEFAADDVFPPRWLVGRYFQYAAGRTVAALPATGSALRVQPQTVRALVMGENRLWARGDDWSAGPFDHAVLCPGGPPPSDPYRLTGAAGYIHVPYPLSRSLAEVPAQAKVGIVGSGLTAVDIVMALHARDHQGPIALVSRNGLLPAVRGPLKQHDPLHLTVPRLEAIAAEKGELDLTDVIALARAELGDAGADTAVIAEDVAEAAPVVQRLRDELDRAVRDRDPGWTMLRDTLVACGQDAWYLLRDEDKVRVRARHQTLMRLCCPMPPVNAARLLELFETGQLGLCPEVQSIKPISGRGFHIQAARDVIVDVVIAASTPAKRQLAPAAAPQVTALVSQGLAVPHPFGGVRVDRTTSRLISRRGVAHKRLHALGDITHGAYLFTFGLPVLAARADCIARDITATTQHVQRAGEPAERDQHAPTLPS